MALSTKIKEYRERDGIKQAELAERVGVRRETIVNLERGRYNPSLKLAMDMQRSFMRRWRRSFPIQRIEILQDEKRVATDSLGAESAALFCDLRWANPAFSVRTDKKQSRLRRMAEAIGNLRGVF